MAIESTESDTPEGALEIAVRARPHPQRTPVSSLTLAPARDTAWGSHQPTSSMISIGSSRRYPSNGA